MRFGSLFSGIGGLDLGLERAGMECAWQVEIDEWCQKVLAKHWPDVPKYRDIKEVDFGRVEPVELIAGGFPCQDLSYAGKGAGLSGDRSGLWSEFKRAVCDLRPEYVLVENVAGLLGRGMGIVLGDLASLGYDAEWESLPAAAFGAPHLRWRVFIVAYASGYRCSTTTVSDGKGQALSEVGRGGQGDVANPKSVSQREQADEAYAIPESGYARTEPSSNGQSLAHADFQGLEVGFFGASGQASLRATKRQSCSLGGVWATEPNVGRVAHGIPNRIHRLRGLGNAVVPQVAQWIGERILERHQEEGAA